MTVHWPISMPAGPFPKGLHSIDSWAATYEEAAVHAASRLQELTSYLALMFRECSDDIEAIYNLKRGILLAMDAVEQWQRVSRELSACQGQA